MTPAAILLAVLNYGPSVLPIVQSLATMIKSNKTEVTPEDIQALIDLGKKSAQDYLDEAGGPPK